MFERELDSERKEITGKPKHNEHTKMNVQERPAIKKYIGKKLTLGLERRIRKILRQKCTW